MLLIQEGYQLEILSLTLTEKFDQMSVLSQLCWSHHFGDYGVLEGQSKIGELSMIGLDVHQLVVLVVSVALVI